VTAEINQYEKTDPESIREIAGSKLVFMELLVMKTADSILMNHQCRKEI
jgi:hypothetical protein